MSGLPIDEVLPRVLASLAEHPSLVLEAPTGAGKTTGVPPALLDAGMGPVVVLEPRRLAARAAARWMAAARGGAVGGEVGYQVRFDRKASRDTRLLVVTEGVLLRFLQDDPFLEGYGAVVLDEFHERSLEADLALALVRRVQQEARPDLKLVVMSATLEGDAVARSLGGCPVVRSEGRAYPVDVRYLPAEREEREEAHVARGVRAALDAVDGDVLVFLAGTGEIRRAEERLAGLKDVDVLPLYGDLPAERQDAALRRGPRRKVVLATNVAETSVTVDGVAAVVDTGLARVLRHDAGVGLDRLERGPISVASSDQRAGRAGRQGPGVCVRLWSAHEQKSRPAREEPAVRRLDLAGPALQLACWGERDLAAFPWFEAPRPEALARATTLLERLGALDAGAPTDEGRALARLPVAPRLGKLLLEGGRRGVPGRAALAAGLLAERDPFERAQHRPGGGPAPRARVTDSDLLDRVEALEAFVARGDLDAGPLRLRRGAARFVQRAAAQFERMLDGAPAAEDPDTALLQALLAAFPDRLCRRRAESDERAVMVGGRGVVLGKESGVTEAPLFLALDLDGRGADARVRLASGVDRAWLGEPREVATVVFDPERSRVVGRRELRLGELVLEAHDQGEVDAVEAERVLLEAARSNPASALALDREEVASFLQRAAWLRDAVPELELPAPDPLAVLPSLVLGARSFADLRRAPLLHGLKGLYDHRQLQAIERDAPERLRVPSGSSLRLAYEVGRPPVLAVKIQELFGLAATPTVAGGRVRVLLHLLAPNGRPQQVTDDLASFWANTYVQVRKDLRGRYPKHPWPEDPLAAEATRRTKRR